MCVCACGYVAGGTCMCLCVYLCVPVHVCVCVCMHAYMRMCVCLCVFLDHLEAHIPGAVEYTISPQARISGEL